MSKHNPEFKDHNKTQFYYDDYGYLTTFRRSRQRALFERGNHKFIRFLADKEPMLESLDTHYIKSVWRLTKNSEG